EHHGPRKKKCDLEVEQNEQDSDEVIAHVETHACIFERLEAALVWRELFRIGLARTHEHARKHRSATDREPDDDEEQDRNVGFEIHACWCARNVSGADGETRTHTAFAATPSRWCVYQFHHVGHCAGIRRGFYFKAMLSEPARQKRARLSRHVHLGMSPP